LLEHGWDVVTLDRVPAAPQRGDFVRVDLTDYGQAVEALSAVDDRYRGVDALVHLAAVPAPGLATNAATFSNNMTSTYNVFSAARHAGITNIVWASSETVLGLPFDPSWHEAVAAEGISVARVHLFGREVPGGAARRQLCRWDPRLKMIGLRFSNVMELTTRPSRASTPTAGRKWNLWGYIDARDGAQAVRLALEYQATGVDIFIIANADTVMSRPNRELLAEVFPDVPVRGEIGEHDTLLSIVKARRVLGYQPSHSWRDEVQLPE
jgi:nucleoside-diphosphate-sugar epimerase